MVTCLWPFQVAVVNEQITKQMYSCRTNVDVFFFFLFLGEHFNFNVDPVTGELLNSACIDADLGETSYTFNLVAYNYPSTSIQNGTLSLTLNIHDINDNPPNLVNYGKKVLERELITPGEQLFNITISDSDLVRQIPLFIIFT